MNYPGNGWHVRASAKLWLTWYKAELVTQVMKGSWDEYTQHFSSLLWGNVFFKHLANLFKNPIMKAANQHKLAFQIAQTEWKGAESCHDPLVTPSCVRGRREKDVASKRETFIYRISIFLLDLFVHFTLLPRNAEPTSILFIPSVGEASFPTFDLICSSGCSPSQPHRESHGCRGRIIESANRS